MRFISEKLIEQAAERLNASESAYEQAIDALRVQQPVLLSYFFTEDFQAFTQKEKEYLLYLLLIIWEACRINGEPLALISEEQVSQAEELNWELFQGAAGQGFHQKAGLCFEGYAQEDLLAFAEDALVEDEGEEEALVSPEGREAMFISLKTAIDCLSQAARQHTKT
jgi:hypothetical protein